MKKCSKAKKRIIITLAVVLVLCMIPIKIQYKDGRTVYQAVLWRNVHYTLMGRISSLRGETLSKFTFFPVNYMVSLDEEGEKLYEKARAQETPEEVGKYLFDESHLKVYVVGDAIKAPREYQKMTLDEFMAIDLKDYNNVSLFVFNDSKGEMEFGQRHFYKLHEFDELESATCLYYGPEENKEIFPVGAYCSTELYPDGIDLEETYDFLVEFVSAAK